MNLRVILTAALTASSVACSSGTVVEVPLELKERMPSIAALRPAVPPSSPGAEESGSAAVFTQINTARSQLAALGVLDAYFTEGGERDRGVAPVIAIEPPPHVADRAVRYSRDPSRLDVEMVGDHVFYYLQHDAGDGFDPDSAIGESRMLIDGSSSRPKASGTRAKISEATGLAKATRGYLRAFFGRDPKIKSSSYDAVQLDYDLGETVDSLLFTYYFQQDFDEDEVARGFFYVIDREAGVGFAARSDRRGGSSRYAWLAQFRTADGSMAVWDAEGALWGCYDADGQELGNKDNPAPCADFDAPFPQRPSVKCPAPEACNVWPGYPGSVPRE